MKIDKIYFLFKNSKKFRYALMGTCFAAIASFSFFLFAPATSKSNSVASEEVNQASPVVAYSVLSKNLKKSFITQTFLLPWKEALMRPQPQSTVRKIHVHVGDEVKIGELLVSLDSELQALKTELEQTEIEMRNIDLNVTRALAKNSFLSKTEYKQKELEHKANSIRNRMAQLDNSMTLKSPIVGRVAEISLKEGDYVDQSTAVHFIRIVDDSKLRAITYLPSEVAKDVTSSSSVIVRNLIEKKSTVDAEIEKGLIASLSPIIDVKTGTVSSEIYLESKSSRWRPGTFVELEFVLAEKENAIAVPQEAIIHENGQSFVYVIKSESRGPASSESTDVVKRVEVKLGLRDQSMVEVAGIEEMDQVVVQGQGGISDGAKVEVVE